MKKTSVLPAGLVFEGEISGSRDLVIRGSIHGDVEIDGALTIEEGGAIHGDVRAREILVRGVLLGDATAESAIAVDAMARMVGDLTAPRVRVVEGARFRGKVRVTGRGERGLPLPPSPTAAPLTPSPPRSTGSPAEEPDAPSGEMRVAPGATVDEDSERAIASPSRERGRPGVPAPRMPPLGRVRGHRRHLA